MSNTNNLRNIPLLSHIGDDYAKIKINGKEHEIQFSLMKDLYISNNLSLDTHLDNIVFDEFIELLD